jgi:hypothetical protein
LTINSNPPGALVRIDDEDIGQTPVSVPFTYYGTRKVQLIRPGYETLTVLQRIKAPWYEYPGIDFFSEHFALHEVRDERDLFYELKPAAMVPNEQLLQRAEQLRNNSRAAAADPLAPPAATIPGLPPAPVESVVPPPGAIPPVQPLPPPPGAGAFTPGPTILGPLPPAAPPPFSPPPFSPPTYSPPTERLPY